MDSCSSDRAGFGFAVGQEVTVTRRLWEPADGDHPGGLLALPGDRLIVRAMRDRGQWPISVSHHDRTDGMTFSVAPDELRAHPSVPLPEPGQAASGCSHTARSDDQSKVDDQEPTTGSSHG